MIVLAVIALALIVVGSNYSQGQAKQTEEKELFFYCGAGLRPPVSEIVKIFSGEHNVKIDCSYAGSGTLLNQIKVTKRGDLYMPGGLSWIDLLEPTGLVESKHTVCYFIPIILVKKGNPKNIKSLEDLVKSGIRLGLGDPKACAIGRITIKILKKNNIKMEEVKKNLVFNSLTVNELGVQIQVGKVDAVIVWDATASYFTNWGDVVKIPRDKNIISTVPIAQLSCSKHKELARELVNFIISKQGQEIFQKHHYSTELTE